GRPDDRHRGFRPRLGPDIRANFPADADQDRQVMSATPMTRRKAPPRPRRSTASRDPARLVALPPSSNATIKQSPDPLPAPPNTPAYHPVRRPSQLLPSKSTIPTMSLEANSP